MTTVLESPEFKSWLAGCQKIVEDYFKKSYPTLSIPVLRLEPGEKYCRVVIHDSPGSAGSAWAFVALVESNTKALGKVLPGDVLKCAGYKTPARHARGNIFDQDNGLKHIDAYGPAYLNFPYGSCYLR